MSAIRCRFTPSTPRRTAGSRRAVLLVYALVTYFAPDYLGHPDNYIPANPLATPAHIVPEWYFWPFYAILRSFTLDFVLEAKLWGVLAMFGSILLLFFLPWLDKSPVRSGATGRYSSGSSGCLSLTSDPRLRRRGADLAVPYCTRPGRGGLLFPPLPGGPAAGLEVRDDASVAQLDQRLPCFTEKKRKQRRWGRRSRGAAPRPRPVKGTGRHMVRYAFCFVGLVFAGVLLISMISNAAGYFSNPPAPLASDEFHREPKELPSPAMAHSASSTRLSFSAASRSIRRSVRPATA